MPKPWSNAAPTDHHIVPSALLHPHNPHLKWVMLQQTQLCCRFLSLEEALYELLPVTGPWLVIFQLVLLN